MSGSLERALELIAERSRDDPELAGALRTVLEELLARLPEAVSESPQQPVPTLEEGWDEPTSLEETPRTPAYAEWPDLSIVQRNLTLKARAARWVALHGYTEDREGLTARFFLLHEARTVGVYLWMLDSNRVDLEASDDLTELAELFELTKQALAFWQDAADTL